MKKYLQGLMTGVSLVIVFIVLTAQGYVNPNLNEQKLRSNAQRNVNNPVGRFEYGMERFNNDMYYAWMTNTQTGEVVVRKVSSISNNDQVFFYLSWDNFVKELNRRK